MYSKISNGNGNDLATFFKESTELVVAPERNTTVKQDRDAQNGTGPVGFTYQFRIYLPRCEAYALRLSSSEVTGIYGPIEYDEVLFQALPDFPYENQVDCIDWVKANFSDFVPCDDEYDESMLWI